MNRVLLLSLLKSCLERNGIACDVRYLTFPFAEYIGCSDYHWIARDLPYTAFAGDWLFTQALYGDRPGEDRAYVDQVLRAIWRLDDASIARLQRIRRFVGPFMDHCMASIPWDDYALVGFTSTFEQNIASLSLARRIKDAHPEISVTFGGANWEGEMGLELHRRFPFVDFVCSGEAEQSFPALVGHVLGGEPMDDWAAGLPGIVYRNGDASVSTGAASLIRNLDELPVPDYTDYFADWNASTIAADVAPGLLIETSRGCWWGAKSHCTFCGLNGGSLAFRSKSAERALAELLELVERWQVDTVEAVDNILDMHYFDDLLPALATLPRRINLFFEVKANLSYAHLRMLQQAGVYRIQPGLESLSDHVLKLMRKGTTALRNVQLLKWCVELGIGVDWNVLYGFPGETAEDYARSRKLLDAIRFLPPPTGYGKIRLDRFSPYFESPAAFGFTNVRPSIPYPFLYPFPAESLARIAYYFDYDYAPEVDPKDVAQPLVGDVAKWRANPELGRLSSVLKPDGSVTLIDTRASRTFDTLDLSGVEQAAYEFCDELHSGSSVVTYLRGRFPGQAIAAENVTAFLDALVANRLMVSDGVHYLSLAIPEERPAQAPPEPGAKLVPLPISETMMYGSAIAIATW